MKTPHDPRHIKREKAIKALYSFSFNSTTARPIPKESPSLRRKRSSTATNKNLASREPCFSQARNEESPSHRAGGGFKKATIKNQLAKSVAKKIKQIDKIITKAAPEWPIEQINRIDLAILRLAVFELTIQKKEPAKVIIDEAVELAKKFGSEKSPNFVNGALGTIFKAQKL